MAPTPKRPKRKRQSHSKPKGSSKKQPAMRKPKSGETLKPATSTPKTSSPSRPKLKPKAVASKTKTKAGSPQKRASGANRALVVGISDYPAPLKPLPAVAADVREIGKILKSKDGAFRNGGVTSLAEKTATRAKILALLRLTLAEASPDETVFVYLAGHGHVVKGSYYYIAYDTDTTRLAETGVPLTQIKALFDASKSQRVFLWLDFCHSGGILVRGRRPPMPEDRSVIERAVRVIQGEGKIILAACSPDQSAVEDSRIGHGLFTDALLRGLKGAAKVNGEVTSNSLFDFIDSEIGCHDQRPMQYGHLKGRIVLMHYRDRSTAPGKPKVTAPKNSKIKNTPSKTKSVAKSKDTWVMLDSHFFLAQTIRLNGDGSTTLLITSASGDDEANLKSLQPGPFGGGSTLPFAWKNEAGMARVRVDGSVMEGQRHVWTISLTPQDKGTSGTLYEPSYNMGGQSFSADDIAEFRAKRILLNDQPKEPNRDRSFEVNSTLESYIQGTSGRPEVRASPIPSTYAEYRGDRNWKHYARLRAVHMLKTSATVDHILELEFGAVRSGRMAVKFRGRRDRAGSNKPNLIEFNGTCSLE